MRQASVPTWPVLTRYDQNHLRQVALPLGGIGTGTVSLGGRGQLCAWEVGNRPAKNFVPRQTFFALYTRVPGGKSVARALEGVLPPPYEGSSGSTAANHGLPRFRKASFEAAYPFGQVLLSDTDVPVDVRIQGFNPLVPADADASGIPVAILRFVLTNKTSKPVAASVCGSVANFIGTDGTNGKPDGNVNEERNAGGAAPIRGVFMRSAGVAPDSEFHGTMALATTARDTTCRTDWAAGGWGVPLLDFWDDFIDDGELQPRPASGAPDPMASLTAAVKLPPRATRSVTFLIAWHFPNRRSWYPAPEAAPAVMTDYVRRWQVSDFQPVAADFSAMPYPAAPEKLGFESMAFGSDFCDLHPLIGPRESRDEIVYFKSRFECSEPMKLIAALGYDGPVKFWLDGQEQFCDPRGSNPAKPDDALIPFNVSRGEHEIVIGLGTNRGKAWGIFLRLRRADLPKSSMSGAVKAAALPRFMAESGAACGCGGACGKPASDHVGNYYTSRYADAWDVAKRTAAELPRLEARTLAFVNAFCSSDLPAAVKEAALYNLSTLRSQTCFRIAEGYLFGWEGCGDTCGCCHGSCTHVWNYENATGFLFGELAWTMREAEFKLATRADGLMSFRIDLPLAKAGQYGMAAADGQMGTLMRLYREWQLSGDDDRLRALWPKARKTMEFCWIPGGWDADKDGVMEGCQHNTMDVEYYGPNPQMGIWYLGALRACEEMARHLGDRKFASECRSLFERGRVWLDANLFNGEYYEHQIRPPADEKTIAPGLRVGMGARDLKEPDFQIGNGCLVDQLVGQYMAHALGLGYLTQPENVRKTLRSIMRYNFRANMHAHFNNMRSFALNDESALLMASYPRGSRLKRPFPYYNEVMTGFEYTAAVGMLYEGQVRDGLRCIRAVRKRYDGARRNPFDEAECGHHYARAMASWTAVPALTGFHYSAPRKTMTFAPLKGVNFWSNGYAWGTCRQQPVRDGMKLTLEVLHGELRLQRFELRGFGSISFPTPKKLTAGRSLRCRVVKSAVTCEVYSDIRIKEFDKNDIELAEHMFESDRLRREK